MSARPSPHRCRRVRPTDLGASGLEYGAVILVGALVLGVLGAFIVPGGPAAQNIEYAMCKLVKGEKECVSPKEKDLKPTSCTTSTTTNSQGNRIDIAFLQLGSEVTLIRSTDSTGRVTITAINTRALGATAGLGATAQRGNAFALGADIDVTARFKLGNGDSWVFDSGDEADRFVQDIRKKAAQNSLKGLKTLIPALGGKVIKALDTPDLRGPDITRREYEFGGTAEGSIGGIFGNSKDASGGPTVKPNLRGYVSIEAKNKAVIEEDRRDGSRSVTFEVSGGSKIGAGYVVGNKEFRGQLAGAMKLTYDKSGKLTKLTLTRTTILNNELTTSTTELPLRTDAERRVVQQHLSAEGNAFKGTPAEPALRLNVTPLKLTWDDMAPATPPGPDATPLQRLLYQQGKSHQVDYDYASTDLPHKIGIKLGLKLGWANNKTDQDQKAKGARYLGAPGPDGRRVWKQFKECRA
ncbi:hypothetical protein [Spirillospora sp. CA-294931]|uniref:hypothetical protein n=1 Tax=Spirillospora sp. CA-294931 TaxID=3240042 RepID=UPI003D8F379F